MVGDNPALLQWNLSTRTKADADAFDRESMSDGKLVAVEGYTKSADKDRRFRWEDLPESVRFVTSPIGVNYHRVFFVPPRESRIASVRVNDQDLELPNSGRQPSDRALSPSLLRPRRCSPGRQVLEETGCNAVEFRSPISDPASGDHHR